MILAYAGRVVIAQEISEEDVVKMPLPKEVSSPSE